MMREATSLAEPKTTAPELELNDSKTSFFKIGRLNEASTFLFIKQNVLIGFDCFMLDTAVSLRKTIYTL